MEIAELQIAELLKEVCYEAQNNDRSFIPNIIFRHQIKLRAILQSQLDQFAKDVESRVIGEDEPKLVNWPTENKPSHQQPYYRWGFSDGYKHRGGKQRTALSELLEEYKRK